MKKDTDNYEAVKHVKLSIELPTLEEGLEICKEFDRPLNYGIILLNSVSPMVTKGGIILSKEAHADAQNTLNKKGMLVVMSPFVKDNIKNKVEQDLAIAVNSDINPNAVYVGEHVLYQQESPSLFTRVITTTELLEGLVLREGQKPTSEMYKKYIVICMHINYLTVVLK